MAQVLTLVHLTGLQINFLLNINPSKTPLRIQGRCLCYTRSLSPAEQVWYALANMGSCIDGDGLIDDTMETYQKASEYSGTRMVKPGKQTVLNLHTISKSLIESESYGTNIKFLSGRCD